ncbi:PSP1 C-terminal conserved region family protein [Histomonas meleagridis]|uniref:PSP1 C-terminal conserved region family protein n=1 Tax=Histomonas meleagridis TaxID=135588 RepID=UPI003559822D|nr:PSP1 C-terminal conserved region family protein [Histomonas meleagridis]KAH0798065.1 PSP1 C-terminal conserved region family protein [Histomonas meleagridis]
MLPSSLRDEFGEESNSLEKDQPISTFTRNYQNENDRYLPESAPSSPLVHLGNVYPRRQSDLDFYTKYSRPYTNYCLVQFHQNRVLTFSVPQNLELHVGDYVITEADRGIDIGLVTSFSISGAKNTKNIKRKASASDINNLPIKLENERNALKICQKKVEEMGLPMEITGAEYQYDGKKLTFYFTAKKYIDFRGLVKVLFHIFSTRIWMVWHDGIAPVKDVLTRDESFHGCYRNRKKL